MSPAVVPFEVLRFEAVPAAAGVAVVELDGRFGDLGAAPVAPRLLVEGAAGAVELPAVEVVGAEPWSATFAVPLEALGDVDAAFALVPGRGPLIALPAPSLAGADDDRFVRLARTVNELRHRLSETSARAADADRLRGELRTARARIAELERRAAAAEQDAANARSELAEAEQDLDRRSAELERDAAARIAAADERADEANAALARATAEIAALRERAQVDEHEVRQAHAWSAQLEEQRDAAREELEHTRAHLRAAQAQAQAAQPPTTDDERVSSPSLPPSTGPAPAASSPARELRWDGGEPTQTLELPVSEDLADGPPEDEPEEAVRILRPRSAGARRFTPVRTTAPDDEADDGEEDDDTGEVLAPAAVGARLIEPSTARPTGLTPARMVVGTAVALLFLALVLIFAGLV